MASKIYEWILPTVQDELNAACQFLRPVYQLGETVKEDRYHCSQDRLKIHMTEENPVQLIEFNINSKHGFEVTVSDIATKIRATLSKDSTREFHKNEGRSFTDRTLGGMLIFIDYYLIFNPKSSPSKRFTFEVQQFKVVGSEGSETFGQPHKIEDKPSLCDITANLKNLLCGDEDDLRKEMSSPLRSQVSRFCESPTPTSIAMQPIFATQIPENHEKIPQVVGKGHVPSLPKKGAGLLAQLSRPGEAGQNQRRPVEGDFMMLRENLVLRRDADTIRKPAMLQPVMENSMPRISSELEVKSKVQHAQPPLHTPLPLSTNDENEQVIPVTATGPGPSHTPHLSPSTNKEEAIRTPEASMSDSRIMSRINGNQNKPVTVLIAQETEHKNQFQDLKRVPKSYARVPEDQQIILQRKDSWVESENDGRSDYVSVPDQVLQDLRYFMEQQGQKNGDGGNKVQAAGMMGSTAPRKNKADSQRDNSEEDTFESDAGSDAEDETAQESYRAESKILISSPLPSLEIETDDEYDRRKKGDEDKDNREDGDTREVSWSTSPRPVIKTAQGLQDEDVYLEESDLGAFSDAQGDASSPLPFSLPITSSANDYQLPSKNFTTRVQPRIDRDFDFPSSSLGIEEELEVDIPHAIGDQVEDSDSDMDGNLEASQHLPLAAAYRDSIVQVEHTPFHNQRVNSMAIQTCGPLREQLSPFDDGNRLGEDVSSDFIIPATFDDASQGIFPPILKDRHTASVVDTSVSESKAGAQTRGDALAGKDSGFERVEDSAEQQLLQDLISSQHNARTDTSERVSPASVVGVNATNNPSHGRAVSPDSDHKGRYSLKRDIDSVVGQKLERPNKHRNRINMTPSVIHMSQENRPMVSIHQMAQDYRRNFINPPEIAAAPKAEIPPLSKRAFKPRQEASLDGFSPLDIPLGASLQNPAISTDRLSFSTPATALPDDPRGERLPNDIISGQASQDGKSPSRATSLLGEESYIDNGGSTSAFKEYSTAFHMYVSAYPNYKGSQKRFTESLCYIEWLVSERRKCPSQSLWDDFISTMAAEYVDYIREVRDNKIHRKDALLAVDFFINRSTGKDPTFRKRIIISSTIEEAILSLDPDEVEKVRGNFISESNATNGSSRSVTSTPTIPSMPTSQVDANDIGPYDDAFQPGSPDGDRQSGSRRNVQENTALKRPYFETQSQIQISRRAKSPSSGLPSAKKTPGSGRRLPWLNPTSHSPVSRRRNRELEVSPPFTPKVRARSKDIGVIEYENSDVATGSQSAQGSPILGLPEKDVPTLSSKPKNQTSSPNSLPRIAQQSITPFTTTSKKMTGGTRSAPRTRITHLSKVNEWLADQNTASSVRGNEAFKQFLQRRKSAGLLPNSTPKSNFCTKRSGTPGIP